MPTNKSEQTPGTPQRRAPDTGENMDEAASAKKSKLEVGLGGSAQSPGNRAQTKAAMLVASFCKHGRKNA